MTTYNIDQEKIRRMVSDTLLSFNNSGAHPAEVVVALAESIGRVIAVVPGTDLVQRELLDIAIKHMAGTIDAGRSRIIEH